MRFSELRLTSLLSAAMKPTPFARFAAIAMGTAPPMPEPDWRRAGQAMAAGSAASSASTASASAQAMESGSKCGTCEGTEQLSHVVECGCSSACTTIPSFPPPRFHPTPAVESAATPPNAPQQPLVSSTRACVGAGSTSSSLTASWMERAAQYGKRRLARPRRPSVRARCALGRAFLAAARAV